jgi:UDP-N-acetylmuramoyl-tripeptide--D-alanyl-D-alanine ligase
LPAAARGAHARTSEELAPVVATAMRAGDVIVVKGSLASRMRHVVDALSATGADATASTDTIR